MSTENLDKLLASGQTDGMSMIVTVPADLWSKAQDELTAIKKSNLYTLWVSQENLKAQLNEYAQAFPAAGRIYAYEPSEVEKLQRQVDDLIRVLARNAR